MKMPKSVKDAVDKCPLIIGIGPSAWPRVIPSFFFPKFKILSYNDTEDGRIISNFGIDIFSLKSKKPDLEIAPESPGKMVDNEVALNLLSSIKEPFAFLVYKSSPSLEKLCDSNGWKFIGNRKELADKFEDKRIFKEAIRELGIEAIPGDNLKIEDLTTEKFLEYQKKFGQKKMVLQIAEMTYGGGSGTLFVDDVLDLEVFRERVAEVRKGLEGKKKKLETVNVAPFIEGVSTSISCCATKYGTLTGTIQNQIIDITEVGTEIKGRSGNFAGHDWSYRHYDPDTVRQASEIANRFGSYMYEKGYKGVFGMDLIVDSSGKVWPVECNPRYTDAFPVISMLMMEKGLIPFDVFHILEHLNIPYEINFDAINDSYKQNFDASQILIHNLIDSPAVARGSLRAGIYRKEGDTFKYLRPGFMTSDLKSQDEFLMTERVPDAPGRVCYPKGRIFRLIRKGGILKTENSLKPDVKDLFSWIYKQLRLVPAENGLVEWKGLKSLFTYKLTDASTSAKLNTADIVNLLNTTPGGYRRPLKIAWRRILNSDPIIEQISSKRARKQIKSDLKKIAALGIVIDTIDQISESDFDEWQLYYEKVIGSMERGYMAVGKDWLKKKKEKGKKVGAVIARRDGKIIGGELFLEVNGILGIGYGVAEKIRELAGSLTLLLDYSFLEYARSNGYPEVSFGQDTNLYGYDLSPGLIDYKVKLGFYPVPANKTYWVTTYFQSIDKFPSGAVFFGGNKEKLVMIEVRDNKTKIKFDDGNNK